MDVNLTSLQERAKVEAKSYLEQLLSEGARKLLQAAIENEVIDYSEREAKPSLPQRKMCTSPVPCAA